MGVSAAHLCGWGIKLDRTVAVWDSNDADYYEDEEQKEGITYIWSDDITKAGLEYKWGENESFIGKFYYFNELDGVGVEYTPEQLIENIEIVRKSILNLSKPFQKFDVKYYVYTLY